MGHRYLILSRLPHPITVGTLLLPCGQHIVAGEVWDHALSTTALPSLLAQRQIEVLDVLGHEAPADAPSWGSSPEEEPAGALPVPEVPAGEDEAPEVRPRPRARRTRP